MAESFKILGQAGNVSDSSFGTTLYTVPEKPNVKFAPRDTPQALVSSIVVCNRHASADGSYSIRVVPNGETPADKHIIFYTNVIQEKTTHVISLGLGLQVGDKIEANATVSGSDTISMSAFGIEMV